MKIDNKGCVAAIYSSEGTLIGVIGNTIYADRLIEQAIASHFDYANVMLVDSTDFEVSDERAELKVHIIDEHQEIDQYDTFELFWLPLYEQEQTAPVDFESWHEAHFDISSAISLELHKEEMSGIVQDVHESVGTGGLYEMARDLTNKFEEMYKGTVWGVDLEYLDTMEEFCQIHIHNDK